MQKKKISAKEFKNCIHYPLFHGEDSEILIKILPPSELHLCLRITNKLINEMEKVLSSSGADMSADVWFNTVGVVRPKLHGGEFNGNMCRRLLTNLDSLEDLLHQNNRLAALPFVKALRQFNEVCIACFGNELHPDFEAKLLRFKEIYLQLDVSVSTSVHVVINHVYQFCKFRKASLGKYSEQASEAVHSDFDDMWVHSGKTSMNNINYSKNLLSTTIRYNSRHI